ncbi:hypothetical protein [Gloeocapsopsis dulcis]|uniref:Uncharacterized protein n=1 Tax=Gloeocapsopsis dulcis AAB1 = 1H9 TaxID=1433147 RepID=A0A6N8G1G0_9CHRO|nr:hypothetical protein [Gloeocapsopsis dulcis]MUL38784.1 hypothetical protein [Gloeocapsopsis dulcis AAB1 = 1H9]WNN91789.1 hypothetical protein P0S91_12270 [Gloeocapsopsis dulcis]
MKIPRLLNQIVLGTVAGVGLASLLLPQASLAQVTNSADPQEIFRTERNSDPFSSQNANDSWGMFDLIHRAQLGTMRDPYEYANEQNQNINSAASAFRERQRQLMQQSSPQQVAPANSAPPTIRLEN